MKNLRTIGIICLFVGIAAQVLCPECHAVSIFSLYGAKTEKQEFH